MMFTSSPRVARSPEARHPFERCGFGKAPYRFIGQEEAVFRAVPDAPAQPGSSCDYCGTGIMGVFWFQSSEKVLFKVGCDCLKKASKDAGDYPLQTIAAKLDRDHNRKIRHAREEIKIEELKSFLAAEAANLQAVPHPYRHRADKGETLADHCTWMMAAAGNSGKCDLLRYLKNVQANNWQLLVVEMAVA